MSVTFDQAVMEGLDASKPAASAGTVGRLYFATDTGKVYRDNGSAWVERANDLQLGTTATTAAAGNDSRLSDARTPTAHATSHQSGGSDAFTGIVPASAFAPAGLTGATAASRYVGATASGAPASGTFAVGDFVIDQTGTLWVCTTAGSPGTWTQIAGGGGGSGAWTQIATQTLAAATASVTFSSIPGTYRALQFIFRAAVTGATTEENSYVRANGDTGANYDYGGPIYDYTGTSLVVTAHGDTKWLFVNLPGTSSPANSMSSGVLTLPGYADTTIRKGVFGLGQQQRDDSAQYGRDWHVGGRWRSTAAITSLTFAAASSTLAAGSTFALYGLT